MITGSIKNLNAARQYGFIRDTKGIEYFFHKDEFMGHWKDLVEDIAMGGDKILVTFNPTETPKGLRAVDVSRIDHPNTGR